jgi:hypothetical protein
MRLAVFCSLLLAACSSLGQDIDAGLTDLQEAEATNAVTATLFNSPPLPLLDGGLGPSVAGLSVFFGSRAAGATTTAPTGIAGATVIATDTDGMTAVCADQGNGTYTATSLTFDGGIGLRYDPGATYTFTVISAGTTYTAGGMATQPETVPAFEQTTELFDGGPSLPIFAVIPVNSQYVLERTVPPNGAKLNVAFVAANALAAGTPSATPTWTDVPQTPLALLELLVNDSSFRTATIAIPASAFPSAGEYLVTLTVVQEGNQISSNLFLGSTVLIGAGSAGILRAE